ncbi:MAG: c-type cytochrome biogenesis protein CcsB [Thermodesulfobacteriota bacterium]
MELTAFYITVGLYLIATCAYTSFLFTHREGIVRLATKLLFAAFVFHIITLLLRYFVAGRTPAINLFESLSFYSLLVVLIFLIFEIRYRLPVLGSFIVPFALVLLITASFQSKAVIPLPPTMKTVWLPIHITLAFLGNAFFALAGCAGIMYLIQEHYLKSHKVRGLYFLLPSLDVLDKLNHKCLVFGLPLLTLAIITGSVGASFVWGPYWSLDPRFLWSLITWALYALLLHGRIAIGWRGKRAACLAISAFAVLIVSFFSIKLLSLGAHTF